MALEARGDLTQLAVGRRHDLLEVGNGVRRADAGHHVLALRVLQELPVEDLVAVGRVAREAHACGRAVAHVPEHHRLHVDGRAEVVRDVVQLAVRHRARVHPGAEDRVAGALELRQRVLWEIVADLLLDDLLVAHDHFIQRGLVEVHVGLDLLLGLDG